MIKATQRKVEKHMLKKSLALILSIALTVSLCLVPSMAVDTSSTSSVYSVTEPYVYPVVPGTDEWEALDSLAEKIEACSIDENTLAAMSTPALVETVITYPLLINIYAFNSVEEGIESVSQYFDGIQVLLNRENAAEYISSCLQMQTFSPDSDEDLVRESYLSTLYLFMTGSQITPYVVTPSGSPVDAIYNMTWADHGFTQAQAQENLMKATYPNAVELAGINPAYNCHSYAFYSASTSNKYWINDPNPYLADGSYSRMTSAGEGYRVCWPGTTHSGIVSSASGSTVRVTSKWGTLGLFRHLLNDCPYSGSVTYWRG